ncbi:Arc family DNA-binding protein [Shinella sumterensis]|nr:Arc family DNA-binding protein [Shinella sumterensis]
MAREDLHFRLRIPEGLKNKVEEAADRNGRSMTAEMVDRLELSFNEGSRQDYQRRVDLLLDNEARMKDHFKDALNALARGDAEKAQQILTPLAWYERPAAEDNGNGAG